RGTSFAESAVAKARYFAKRGTIPTLAEDSGLEVDALEGAPGVFSARWAKMHGAGVGDAANNALLLERLAGVPDEQRTARYRCVVAYLDTPLAKPQLVEATCDGRILTEPRGGGGFGYDPLFFSSDLGMTFAEAPMPAKQRVSHRDRKSTRLNSSHVSISYAVFCLIRPPPGSTLFPYTTLFRSRGGISRHAARQAATGRGNVRRPDPHRAPRRRRLRIRSALLFQDRKSTRLNSSHVSISYAVFCLKKKMLYD